MSKPHGAGILKRGIVVKAIEIFEKHFESNINERFLDAAVKNMGDAKVFVCGHKHPDKTQIIKHKGKTIVVLKRGISIVSFNDQTGEVTVR
jgi:hypothetical protein